MALKAFYLGHGIASSKTYITISCDMVDAAIHQFEGSDSPESVSRADMQEEIDNCHLKAFGESRSDRRRRLAKTTDEDPTEGSATDWEKFDSPAFERAKANR